jgi:hypothetical protein
MNSAVTVAAHHLTMRRSDEPDNGTSVLNPSTTRIFSNLVYPPVGPTGVTDIDQGGGGGQHLIFDITGYFS